MNEEPETAEGKSGPGLRTLLKAGAFVTAIVVVECVCASIFVPSPEETLAVAERIAAESKGDQDSGETSESEKTNANSQSLREVSLGTFSVTSYLPATNSTLRIDFELFGTVVSSDEGTFSNLLEQNNARLSEQIHSTFRGIALNDLTDSGLGLIKRRIMENCNRTLGKPILHSVIFSKLSFMER